MKVELISWTPNPLALIWHVYQHEKQGIPYPENSEAAALTTQQLLDALRLFREDWNPIGEMPQTIWSMVVPRSFHDQIRANRSCICWCSSHRALPADDFWEWHRYADPPHKDTVADEIYSHAMRDAQENYKALIAHGTPRESARHVLPQGIHISMTVCVSLRALMHIVTTRNCCAAQGEYWQPFIESVVTQVEERIEPLLGSALRNRPCDVRGVCYSPTEQMERFTGADPNKACPIWLAKYKQEDCIKWNRR